MRPLPLDTCALLWLIDRKPMREGAELTMLEAGAAGPLYPSAVSVWEAGQPHRKRGLALHPDPRAWVARVLALPFITQAPLTASQALESSPLPGELHEDPGDRLLVATARDLGAALVTRDARLIAYAEAEHMDVLPC